MLFYNPIECLLCRQAQELGTIDEVRDTRIDKAGLQERIRIDRGNERDNIYLIFIC